VEREPTISAHTVPEIFRTHMRRAGALVAERRLPEAEAELVQALVATPGELRALKLLALVRFRLGRFSEARESYRAVAQAAPEDAAARLNLGLIALKLEWFSEAAEELEAAVRLRAGDARALSYLAYAYARLGRTADAAQAFRRAGQPELAAELDGRLPAPPEVQTRFSQEPLNKRATLREFGMSRTEITHVEREATRARRLPAEGGEPEPASVAGATVSLTSFALGRLLSPEDTASASDWVADGILRFRVDEKAYVSAAAVLAADGGLTLERARERQRGRLSQKPLGGVRSFYRCRGEGELWLTGARPRRPIAALALDEDVLYLREELVLAFAGELVWEKGRAPRSGLGLLQFRGSGRVVVDTGGVDMVGVRLSEGRPLKLVVGRLCGWIGRVVVQGVPGPEGEGPAPLVACEGEGVLLIARYGQALQPIHQRAEPGDDGPGPADPGSPVIPR
jgi:tetratricopeptide (TPR) repeat protein